MLQSKSTHVRQHFTQKPVESNPKAFDLGRVDFTLEHATQMKTKIYGNKERTTGKSLHSSASGCLSAPYADEALPPWQSTVQAAYIPKTVGGEVSQVNDGIHIFILLCCCIFLDLLLARYALM